MAHDDDDAENGADGVLHEQDMSQAEFSKFLYENMVGEVASALGQYTALNEEARFEHAHAVVQEQFQIAQQILPTLVDPELLRTYPTIVITVKGPTGNHGSLAIPKNIAGYTDPGLALYNAFAISLLSSTLGRALLRVHGFTYTFAQSKTVLTEKGKIIM
jgi:hypothetical protein